MQIPNTHPTVRRRWTFMIVLVQYWGGLCGVGSTRNSFGGNIPHNVEFMVGDEGAESTAAPLGWLRRTLLKAFLPPCLKSRALKGMLGQLLVGSVIGLSMAPGMTPIIAP